MKFTDGDEFLATINQWIRDGSNLEFWWRNEVSEGVELRGRDGALEELTYYYA